MVNETCRFTVTGGGREALYAQAEAIATEYFGDESYTLTDLDADPIINGAGDVVMWQATVRCESP